MRLHVNKYRAKERLKRFLILLPTPPLEHGYNTTLNFSPLGLEAQPGDGAVSVECHDDAGAGAGDHGAAERAATEPLTVRSMGHFYIVVGTILIFFNIKNKNKR